MSTSMFRVMLVLAAIPLGLLFLDSQRSGGLISAGNVLAKPTIEVLGAPSQLILDEPGTVIVRASAPARPGDTVYLEAAGQYGMGYYRVDKVVLDGNLEATLTVAGRHFLGSYKYWAKIAASGEYQEGRSSTFAISIVSAAAPTGPTCGGVEQVKPDGTPWVCTYNDEFDAPALNRRFWAVQKTESSGFTTGTKVKYACA
ncbi:MAG: hypothetical protein EON52_20215, partial [Actinomycetales bacterium]